MDAGGDEQVQMRSAQEVPAPEMDAESPRQTPSGSGVPASPREEPAPNVASPPALGPVAHAHAFVHSSHVGVDNAEPGGPTTLTFSPRSAAGVSYLFLWISGVLVYFNERRNAYVRFHALQSILFSAVATVVGVVGIGGAVLLMDLGGAWHASLLTVIGLDLAVLIPFSIVLLWWGLIVAAWTGTQFKLPILGDYAERYSAPLIQQPAPPRS